jgi:PAS domain-containing protein
VEQAVKNWNCALPKNLHSKPGGFGSKLFRITRADIFLLLLMIASLLAFPTLSHIYALQPAATAGIGSFANEPILKTIIIDQYAPYTFVNKDGQPDGFSVDLMRAVAKVMGLKLEIKVDTWDNAQKILWNGQLAIMSVCRDITERKRAEEQLNEQLERLRRWQDITQGREDRILLLKSEINRLLIEAGKPARFASLNGVNLEPPGGFE